MTKHIKDLKDLRVLRVVGCYRHSGPTDLKRRFYRSAGPSDAIRASERVSPAIAIVTMRFRSFRTLMSIETRVSPRQGPLGP